MPLKKKLGNKSLRNDDSGDHHPCTPFLPITSTLPPLTSFSCKSDDNTNYSLLDNEENKHTTFKAIGLCEELCSSCAAARWEFPTRIQAAAIPTILEGRDAVGIAQTGSGKTGAYVLPLTDWLLRQSKKVPYLAILVLVPTRELAVQVQMQFSMLGEVIGLKIATLVGGADMVQQTVILAQRPHVIVGTPGRVKDHLENTKSFFLPKLHTLVLDECDRMLDMDYEKDIDYILENLPLDRQTLLFSATLGAKIDKLQRATLKDPVMLQVHRSNSTVDTLQQLFIFAPDSQMTAYLHYYLRKEQGHDALPLMGQMSQENRNLSLSKFKNDSVSILVCTDLAQRGLHIDLVDTVINYNLPATVKDYIHRVGRTARAGSTGRAINLISQYDIVQLQTIEKATGKRMMEWPGIIEGEVAGILQSVEEAEHQALNEIREQHEAEKVKLAEAAKGTKINQSWKKEDVPVVDEEERGPHNDIFQLTKKFQHKSVWKKKREQIKKRKTAHKMKLNEGM